MGLDKKPGKVEAHIRVNLSLLDSPAFIALDWTARALFLDLRHRMRGTNNGNISAALSELKSRGWNSSATLVKALRQLEALGFLRKTRQTIGVMRGSKVCNLYRFTDSEVYERAKLGIPAMNPTDEYKAFKTLDEARQAVAKSMASEKKTALQKMNRDASETEAIGPIDASEIEVTPTGVTSKNEASKNVQTSHKASAHKDFASFHTA
ncbi:MAG: hypothetical protein HHJ17_08600 [Rhodoferax sp.]|uniref:hypothetical protein n=1 Tax=Rhodoferax sp. TaxID=50421 RepID=UPI00179B5CFA|nr:hypothetical protein [Rhodoferax sp.]NMM13580.1 hypothetical protein [Rhodoferax sp.]